MELAGQDHEKWHGFDIIGYWDPSWKLRLQYQCHVLREGEEQFTFIGRLNRWKALSMAGREDLLEPTMKELAFKRVRAIIDLQTSEPGQTIERPLYEPPGSKIEKMSHLDLRRKLLEVFYTIPGEHPRSYEGAEVDIDGLCWELGISAKQYCFAIDYLCDKKLLERYGGGSHRGEYHRPFITSDGMDAHELGSLVGPVVEKLVAETREFVDSNLERLCPKAAEKLAQTYADIVEGDTELRLSQVAYACRQILEDFTDAICDPEFLGEEIERPQKRETKNKIRLALKARRPKVPKREQELFEALAGYINDYFDKLNDYVQKQVHPARRAQVESESAKRCLIYTYLLIADVLSLLS